jgi:hypothetical protein
VSYNIYISRVGIEEATKDISTNRLQNDSGQSKEQGMTWSPSDTTHIQWVDIGIRGAGLNMSPGTQLTGYMVVEFFCCDHAVNDTPILTAYNCD